MKEKKDRGIDYRTYRMKYYEAVMYTAFWALFCMICAYFFYRSWIAFIVLFFLLYPFYLRYIKRILKEKRNWQITIEFKELIRILSTNIQAGSSVENAFINAYEEIKMSNPSCSIVKEECLQIVKGLQNNIVIEELLSSFAKRSNNQEIIEFAQVFSVAKRSGCNLKEIIADTTDVIDLKVETKREFRVLIASKKLEHRIMCVIPFVIIGYITITSPGYFDIFYNTHWGTAVMTACLISYIGALVWGEKISEIKL